MIDERVKKYLSDYTLDDKSMAFGWLCLETLLNLNSDEIIESITDGSMDGGIDAIHISDSNVSIFNFKYTSEYEHSTSNFPEIEFNKVFATMEKIYGKIVYKNDVNEALWDKIQEIWSLFETCTPKFHYYFVSNKEKALENVRHSFERSLEKYRFVNFYYYDQEELAAKIIESKYQRLNGELTFIEKQYFERTDNPLRGVVATMTAVDLINLIKDKEDQNKIDENAFNENIRVYNPKHRINQGIIETALSEDNYEFWYLNNGITIVCEQCEYHPSTRSPRVTLTNFQIVNGGQTSHSLFQAHLLDSEKIDNVLLLVRICETKKNNPITEKISETTNTQIPVRTRDLRSNDPIQKKLEDEFRSLGYFYERKKNQHLNESKDKRLDNELLGQIYLAYYLDMPSEARDQKSLVFGEKYDEIFDAESITAGKMLIPYNIYLPLQKLKRDIQKKKRRKQKISEKDSFVSRATFHILTAVKIIIEKTGRDIEKKRNIQNAIKTAISYINEIVEEASKERGELYTHDKFFKEKPTSKLVINYVLSKY